MLTLLVTQPQLLLDHAQGYAELVVQELGAARAVWRRSALLYVVALHSLSAAAILAGVALLLWAVIPGAQIHAMWALWCTPLLPFALGMACLRLVGRKTQVEPFAALHVQLLKDLAMLRDVGAP